MMELLEKLEAKNCVSLEEIYGLGNIINPLKKWKSYSYRKLCLVSRYVVIVGWDNFNFGCY